MPDSSTGTRSDNYYYDPPNLNVSDEVKDIIIRNHVEPNYVLEISNLFKGKRDWKLVGQVFETTSKSLVAIGGIISFAAGFFNEYYLSFLAGAVSTISLATLQFSGFGYKEAKKQGQELNTIMKKLKLEEIPLNERVTDDNVYSSMRQTMRQSDTNQNQMIRDIQEQYLYQIRCLQEDVTNLSMENEKLKKLEKDEKEESLVLNIIEDNTDLQI